MARPTSPRPARHALKRIPIRHSGYRTVDGLELSTSCGRVREGGMDSGELAVECPVEAEAKEIGDQDFRRGERRRVESGRKLDGAG